MIKGLIITSSRGVPLFYKSYGSDFDSELLSSFLVANDIFSEKMIGESMDKIQTRGKTQFIFEKDDQYKLIFVLIADTSDELSNLQLKLKHIKYAFILNFPDICSDLQDPQGKYRKIPNEQAVEAIINPIILSYKRSGNILEIIKLFGVKNTATIFSSLLSKQNIIIYGKDRQFIEKIILTLPLFLPFREFLISNKIISMEKIGLLIPWVKNFNISQSPDCWWLIGTENHNFIPSSQESITLLDTESKKVVNGLIPSNYEKYLIKSVKNFEEHQIAQLYLANRMQDLLNKVKSLINLKSITENTINKFGIHPSILPLLKKIALFDFSKDLKIHNHYFSNKLKQIFGE